MINADTILLGQQVALKAGMNRIRVTIEKIGLSPGTYVIGLWMSDSMGHSFDHLDSALQIDVVERAGRGFGMRPSSDALVTCAFEVSLE